ncbi:hypothetical protein BDZ91DRAFT_766812 [Kalaharituber pfeilii]|nr:hypothetical protein BDZ91DRAFT_766812 [Kalaharituber pfeilii]
MASSAQTTALKSILKRKPDNDGEEGKLMAKRRKTLTFNDEVEQRFIVEDYSDSSDCESTTANWGDCDEYDTESEIESEASNTSHLGTDVVADTASSEAIAPINTLLEHENNQIPEVEDGETDHPLQSIGSSEETSCENSWSPPDTEIGLESENDNESDTDSESHREFDAESLYRLAVTMMNTKWNTGQPPCLNPLENFPPLTIFLRTIQGHVIELEFERPPPPRETPLPHDAMTVADMLINNGLPYLDDQVQLRDCLRSAWGLRLEAVGRKETEEWLEGRFGKSYGVRFVMGDNPRHFADWAQMVWERCKAKGVEEDGTYVVGVHLS